METWGSPSRIRAMFVMFTVDGKIPIESQPHTISYEFHLHMSTNFFKESWIESIMSKRHLSGFIENRVSLT
jgi:hypothetical protein